MISKITFCLIFLTLFYSQKPFEAYGQNQYELNLGYNISNQFWNLGNAPKGGSFASFSFSHVLFGKLNLSWRTGFINKGTNISAYRHDPWIQR